MSDKHNINKASTSSASAVYSYQMPGAADVSRREVSVASPVPKRVRMKDLTSAVVAESILDFCREHGDLMTNLRLQRILYYTQAWHLAMHDAPLFDQEFEASPSGPIEPLVYCQFAAFNSQPIAETVANVIVPAALKRHINEVMEAYGSLSAFDLERLSKDEEPWKAARATGSEKPIIQKTLMKRYYKLKLPE